ncbi:MAG TPA: carbon-nitrogen hydrolase family protein, partial [Acidimicrobiia bacterium]|nr:carbon-nitrogen hydrolase family protein [Acidimicrobiia bacterium]
VDDVSSDFPLRYVLEDKPPGVFDGGSSIVAPDGSWIVEPVVDEERLLVGEVDPASIRGSRASFDPAGHYSRPDVFKVTTDRSRREAASFDD